MLHRHKFVLYSSMTHCINAVLLAGTWVRSFGLQTRETSCSIARTRAKRLLPHLTENNRPFNFNTIYVAMWLNIIYKLVTFNRI